MTNQQLFEGINIIELDGERCLAVIAPLPDAPTIKEGVSKKGNAYKFEELVNVFVNDAPIDGRDYRVNLSVGNFLGTKVEVHDHTS
jgi:hypothetical protein